MSCGPTRTFSNSYVTRMRRTGSTWTASSEGLRTHAELTGVKQFQECLQMAKVCDVCGRGPQFGNRVSHAHNLTKRRWNINLQPVHAIVKGASSRIRLRHRPPPYPPKSPF